jgi:hypothetical protein
VAADRIRAGLTAFCAADGHAAATDRALEVARALVRAKGDARLDPVPDDASVTCAITVGWATAPTAADARRTLVESLTGAGGDGRPSAAACAIAAMSSYAVARAPLLSVMAAGIEEAGAYGSGDLTSAAVGSWKPPDGGVPAEPLPVVAAVMAALRAGGDSPAAVAEKARDLGGETHIVAALAAAIAAARAGDAGGLNGDDDGDLASLADGLSALRE